MKKLITEYVVYKDGLEVGRYEDEALAKKIIEVYDGDLAMWYEAEDIEIDD